MQYKELCDKITEISGMTAQETQVQKGSATITGITIGDGKIRPTIYPKDFKDMSIDQMAEKMVQVVKENERTDFDHVVDRLPEWDFCKDKLELCIRKKSEKTMQITQDFLDLEKYVRVRIAEDATCPVTETMVNAWGVSQEEVFDNAIVPLPQVQTIESMMLGFAEETKMIDDAVEALCSQETGIIVVTNSRRYNGSSILAYSEFWKKYAEKSKTPFYILPSSIHELLIVPANGESAETFKAMVCGINATQVQPEDQLSNHVYEYKDGKIQIAA